MTKVEKQIKELLTMNVSARALNEALFGRDGLFNQMVHREEDRRRISGSPLFRQAQTRVIELVQLEAAEIRQKYVNSERTGKSKGNGQKKLRLTSTESRPAKHRKSG
jgi:hypothetical protein